GGGGSAGIGGGYFRFPRAVAGGGDFLRHGACAAKRRQALWRDGDVVAGEASADGISAVRAAGWRAVRPEREATGVRDALPSTCDGYRRQGRLCAFSSGVRRAFGGRSAG